MLKQEPRNKKLVICNSVKMGIHLCYKWDKPKEMVKVEKTSTRWSNI